MEIIKDKNSRSGLIGTIIVHLLLLVMFLSFGMTYQDPPEPNEGSMMINFGTSDEGSGEVESEEAASSPSQNVTHSENKSPSIADGPVLTQNNTEAPVVNSAEEQVEETLPEVEVQSASQSLLDALNAANTSSNSKDGNEGDSSKSGNKGEVDGDPKSHGQSNVQGNGIGFNLGGRGKVSFKKPENPTQKDGTIVVEIWVNRIGRVTQAKAGARGSTTTNPILQKQAEEAAFKAVFKADENAPFEQKGTMTFVFILN